MITNYHHFSEVNGTRVIAGKTCGYEEKRFQKTDQCRVSANFRNKFRSDLYKSFMNKNEQLRTGAEGFCG